MSGRGGTAHRPGEAPERRFAMGERKRVLCGVRAGAGRRQQADQKHRQKRRATTKP